MEDRRGAGEAIRCLRDEGIGFRLRENLRPYTTFKIGGEASLFVEPADERETAAAIRVLCKTSPLFDFPEKAIAIVLGKGSNLLICDGVVSTPVLFTGRLVWIEAMDSCKVRVGGGTPLAHLLSFCVAEGLSGLEPLSGIPATIGGMAVMNAGAFGQSLSELVEEVVLINWEGEREVLKGNEITWSYRDSSLRGRGVVGEVMLRLSKSNSDIVKEAIREHQKKRRERQPLNLPSAGSAFKNPAGHYAGELIEKAGLKGERRGDAVISEKHANFIVNIGSAACSDVLELIDYAKRVVFEKFGVRLEEEIEYVC